MELERSSPSYDVDRELSARFHSSHCCCCYGEDRQHLATLANNKRYSLPIVTINVARQLPVVSSVSPKSHRREASKSDRSSLGIL